MVVRGGAKTETSLLAYATLLMMETGIRVGNEESAEGFVSVNKWHEKHGQLVQTFGLTTLLGRHVRVRAGVLTLSFVGKKIVDQTLRTADPFLVGYAPVPDGSEERWLGVEYPALYKFVKKYVGRAYKPKDIRAAKVNRLFIDNFAGPRAATFATAAKKSDRNRAVKECIEVTAETIGHTPGVCRSAYMSKHLLSVLKDYDPATHPTITK
jgi:DNA topoisomerase IB